VRRLVDVGRPAVLGEPSLAGELHPPADRPAAVNDRVRATDPDQAAALAQAPALSPGTTAATARATVPTATWVPAWAALARHPFACGEMRAADVKLAEARANL
jgi:hypothetical protein